MRKVFVKDVDLNRETLSIEFRNGSAENVSLSDAKDLAHQILKKSFWIQDVYMYLEKFGYDTEAIDSKTINDILDDYASSMEKHDTRWFDCLCKAIRKYREDLEKYRISAKEA